MIDIYAPLPRSLDALETREFPRTARLVTLPILSGLLDMSTVPEAVAEPQVLDAAAFTRYGLMWLRRNRSGGADVRLSAFGGLNGIYVDGQAYHTENVSGGLHVAFAPEVPNGFPAWTQVWFSAAGNPRLKSEIAGGENLADDTQVKILDFLDAQIAGGIQAFAANYPTAIMPVDA